MGWEVSGLQDKEQISTCEHLWGVVACVCSALWRLGFEPMTSRPVQATERVLVRQNETDKKEKEK